MPATKYVWTLRACRRQLPPFAFMVRIHWQASFLFFSFPATSLVFQDVTSVANASILSLPTKKHQALTDWYVCAWLHCHLSFGFNCSWRKRVKFSFSSFQQHFMELEQSTNITTYMWMHTHMHTHMHETPGMDTTVCINVSEASSIDALHVTVTTDGLLYLLLTDASKCLSATCIHKGEHEATM